MAAVKDKQHRPPLLPCPSIAALHCCTGPQQSVVTSPLPHTYLSEEDLPKEYDIRDLDGVSYASIDRNQHIPQYCGSCWTQSSVSALSDRMALLTDNMFPEVDLAPQVVISCPHNRQCSACLLLWACL